MIIRAEVLNPPTNENTASNQIQTLIDRIGMKVLMGPFAKYVEMKGNRGLTVAAIIETSHIVLHSWDETDPALIQLDVYTCSNLSKQVVFDSLKPFAPLNIDYKFLDRETSLSSF